MPLSPRLALARPSNHPLCEAVRAAGWKPIPFQITQVAPTGEASPVPHERVQAYIVLSPSGAQAISARLPQGSVCLVQGLGTADAMAGKSFDVHVSRDPKAESLWELVQECFPMGGEFVLVRGERSREFLEEAAENTPFRMNPWITHREVPRDPMPPLPKVEAVLALSPFQAEILAPLSLSVMRFAWGKASAKAFRDAGLSVQGHCEAKSALLTAMLRFAKPKGEIA
jgi:uroporphyrinogen-III synthase